MLRGKQITICLPNIYISVACGQFEDCFLYLEGSAKSQKCLDRFLISSQIRGTSRFVNYCQFIDFLTVCQIRGSSHNPFVSIIASLLTS